MDEEPLQYTHSGSRYLLGYGRDFFGIWDRQQPAAPPSRFPRTEEGWRLAWTAFTEREPFSSEVGIGVPRPAPSTVGSTGPAGTRRTGGAWWLLPILMGWLGGLIAWLVNKDTDPERARAMLITGIAISVVLFLLVMSTLPRTSP